MKKIHLTEEQYKRLINEIQLDGDEALNTTKNINTAVKDVVSNAKRSGVNTDNDASVSFSTDTLKKNGLAEEEEKDSCVDEKEGLKKLNEWTNKTAKEFLFEREKTLSNAHSADEAFYLLEDRIRDEFNGNIDSKTCEKLACRVMKECVRLLESGQPIMEGRIYTKRQLREARNRRLMEEASFIGTKKNLSKNKK